MYLHIYIERERDTPECWFNSLLKRASLNTSTWNQAVKIHYLYQTPKFSNIKSSSIPKIGIQMLWTYLLRLWTPPNTTFSPQTCVFHHWFCFAKALFWTSKEKMTIHKIDVLSLLQILDLLPSGKFNITMENHHVYSVHQL